MLTQTRPEYFYESEDGSLRKISNQWPSTIPRTRENLTNTEDLGVFFPRSGKMTRAGSTCPLQFEEFYVGTKAYLLSADQEQISDRKLDDYLARNPVECAKIDK